MSESHGTSSAEDKILPQCSQKDVAKKRCGQRNWEDVAEGIGRRVCFFYLFLGQQKFLSHVCCCYT